MVYMSDIIRAILGKGMGKRVLEDDSSDDEKEDIFICYTLSE